MGTGTWKLDACPMDGGGVAVYRGQIPGGAMLAAWEENGSIAVRRLE
jgi:hypothetical protein